MNTPTRTLRAGMAGVGMIFDDTYWPLFKQAHHAGTSSEEEWRVLGANGPNVIEARGATQLDAWLEAVEQARALGLAGL